MWFSRVCVGGAAGQEGVEAGGAQLNRETGYRQAVGLPPGRVQAPESLVGPGTRKRHNLGGILGAKRLSRAQHTASHLIPPGPALLPSLSSQPRAMVSSLS